MTGIRSVRARGRAPAWAAGVLAALLAGCTVAPPVPTSTSPASGASGSAPATTPATASPPSPSATPTPTATPTDGQVCLAEAEAMSLAEQAGQLVMVGVSGDLDATERKAITKYHLGAVILMGTSQRGVAKTATLTSRLQKLDVPAGVLIGVDQEGGLVQRLKGQGFDTILSAAKQAKLDRDELLAKATRWGGQLAKAGVQLNLAPVADVVPKANLKTNEPIAKLGRGYGTDPEAVAAKVETFIAGMHAGGVGTAVKHFPGLGAVKGNTDFATRVVDSTTTADSPLLGPFRSAVQASSPTDAVMVSSAVYTKIDGKHQAMFSPAVIGILRDWGFDKVVISDDLGAAKALSAVPAKQRAVRFVAAGGDLAVTVDTALAGPMATGLVERARSDAGFARQLTAAAARVLALKQSYGLISCR
ncbi:MAG: glycoside hydrolase family 3 N-terminal domain-containing protein [Propionicimonas sp.]|nr:glycoside hydrolase family 3 N-terminal domain-containing protein [Propionicimonas sp.]